MDTLITTVITDNQAHNNHTKLTRITPPIITHNSDTNII